jgi:hypothetical protein
LLFGIIPAPILPLNSLLQEMHRVLKPEGRLAVWPAVPFWMQKAIEKSGLFTFDGKVRGVFRFKKIDELQKDR